MTPNLDPSSTPPSTDRSLEEQLARILTKVPPILRLPPPGARCPYSQLSRTGLGELVTPTARNGGKPPVQAIYQRAHRYAKRGIWLIPTENLFRYLLSLGTSSVEEYQKADGFRSSGGDNEIHPQNAALVSRNTRKRGNKLPPRSPAHPTVHLSVEGLS
jgi:hypothetical protein